MANKGKTLDREKQTIRVMVTMYCQAHHGRTSAALCAECNELLVYAEQRLEKCPFGPDKGPCSKCRVHCYKPQLRQRVQAVMRYAGPRMLTRHPIMGTRHVVNSLKTNTKARRPK